MDEAEATYVGSMSGIAICRGLDPETGLGSVLGSSGELQGAFSANLLEPAL